MGGCKTAGSGWGVGWVGQGWSGASAMRAGGQGCEALLVSVGGWTGRG